MTKALIRLFVKNHENTRDPAVRGAYGRMAGVVGICCNLLLFAGKFIAGTVFGSIAIAADAINNLSDASSNIVSLIGFKLAEKPADEDHPYGHARFEYLAGLAVAVMVLVIGVELAKKFRVNLEVVSSLERKPGTKVKEVTKVEKTNIAGVAKDTSIARVALVGLEHNPGVAFQVFDLLSKHNINVDVILQSIGREDTKDITFTVHKKDLEESKQILEEHKETLRFDHIETDESIGKVSIVGAGLMSNCGVAARMFEALYEAGINIQMINTSEIRVSVLLDEEDVNRAVRAIHDKFFGEI